MKTFLFKAFRFTFILVFILGVIEIVSRQMYLDESDWRVKLEYFEKEKNKISLLVIGSSDTEQGIDPDFTDTPAFNLSFGSQDVYYSYNVLKDILPKTPALEYVILGVNPYTLGFDMSWQAPYLMKDYYNTLSIKPRDIFNTDVFLHQLVIWTNRSHFVRDLLARKKRADWSNKEKKVSAVDTTSASMTRLGFRVYTGSVEDIDKSARELHSYQSKFYSKNKIEENFRYLEKVAALLQERGIKLIIISVPEMDSYAKLYSDERNLYLEQISSLQERYPGLSYWGMNTLLKNKKYYYNASHLNRSGAKKFTEQINQKLKNI